MRYYQGGAKDLDSPNALCSGNNNHSQAWSELVQPFDTKCVAGDRELISNNVFRYNQNHAINLMH